MPITQPRWTKPVQRETTDQVFDRGDKSVIVTLRPPNVIRLRLRGNRTSFDLTSAAAYFVARWSARSDAIRARRIYTKRGRRLAKLRKQPT